MDPETSRIVCGHVPVKVKDGEDPVEVRRPRAHHRTAASRRPTSHHRHRRLHADLDSYGFVLAAHEPLESMRAAW